MLVRRQCRLLFCQYCSVAKDIECWASCILSLVEYGPFTFTLRAILPSVLWCCWLGGRKGIRPVKNWVMGCWHGYLSGARCRLAYGPADATATRCLLLFSKIQIGFIFLVPAHLGRPGKGPLNGCMCYLPFWHARAPTKTAWWSVFGHQLVVGNAVSVVLLGPHWIVELQSQSCTALSEGDVHERLRRVHRSPQDQGATLLLFLLGLLMCCVVNSWMFLIFCPMQAPARNLPLIRFLILAL